MKTKTSALLVGSLFLALTGLTPAQAAVDEAAAQALAKANGCTSCHAVDKSKSGPSYQKIAAKYKGKAEGEDKVIKQITTGAKVKNSGGDEMEHKVIDTKDPKELKNLAQWILSR